ncbi:hypothetical protein L6164_029979 [Bauhinia variegata]|uniref:Uncharacterized protein n=1 Tax=Bauhinia variegata TaxID=167791 RepID=A0ACB9LBR2_BAUVA|nr:hypothetical protein L6164_029979 [Bauhinia variegata]
MEEIGVSVASELVKTPLLAAISQVRYSVCFNKYVEELGKEKENLMVTRESVQARAEKAIQEGKKIDIMVEKWLKDANTMIEEVEKLEKRVKSKNTCCFGRCPNLIWRYHVGKQVSEKAKVMFELNNKINFQEFARPVTPPGMEYFSSQGFMYFNSTKVAWDQVMEALKDDKVSMIGLWGMGGCGKTTLVKQLGKAVDKDFNKVVFTVVSNTVDVQKIQGEIASSLDLKLEQKEILLERAKRLRQRLVKEENILIILDDIWKKLDFEEIGIPFGENCKGCKILLTTRRAQVCNVMDCQRIIPLSLLTKEESWTLFQRYAGITNQMSDYMKGLARDITKECGGLPVAIAAVASTLKGKKSESEWKEALEKLKEATPVDIEEGLRNPYSCLQLSYDFLKNEEAKSLFLLCSVFPEDFEIHEEYLARYGIGLGLFGNVSSYERARNQVSEAKNKLLDSSLLLKAEKDQCVKMHDLVRDVALWIAKKKNKKIVGPESSGNVLETNETFEDNTIRYLWCDDLQKLPNMLSYPKLKFLYMEVSDDSILSNDFFKGMEELRVAVLRCKFYRRNLTVGKSIKWLTNLHCLFLQNWNSGDISFLSSLKTLESLVLWNCSFQELPNEIIELKKLRLLDLCGCAIEKNPFEVIGRCSKLEELYFVYNKGSGWENEGKVAIAFLDKNKADSGLKRYRIEIGTSSLFEIEDFSITRGLCVKNFDASTSNATFKDLAQKAEVLRLDVSEKGWKNVIPDMLEATGGGMNELLEFLLYNSNEIECLVDTTNAENVFSKLVKLDISFMEHFETLWRGPHVGMVNALSSLKELELYECPKLTSVFTCGVAQSLVLLERLKIFYCDSLKHIMTDDQKMRSTMLVFPKLKSVRIYQCDELEYLLSVSFAQGLLQLENLNVSYAKMLKHVFGQSLSNHEDQNKNTFQIIDLPVLNNIQLYTLPNLISVCPENYYLTWPSLKELSWKYCPNLKMMSINECIIVDSQAIIQEGDTPKEEKKLGSFATYDTPMIVQTTCSQTVQNLERILVKEGKMEGIFQLQEIPINRELQGLTSCLKILKLYDLNDLIYIFKGPNNFISLENLQTLKVKRCGKLKYIFSASVIGSLPQLEEVSIKFCDELEQIIEIEKPQCATEIDAVDDNPRIPSTSCFPQKSGSINLYNLINLFKFKESERSHENKDKEITHNDDCLQSYILKFPRLRRLKINGCNSLVYIFPISIAQGLQKLEEMEICENEQLKHIFSWSNYQNFSSHQCENNLSIEFPVLKEIYIKDLPNIISVSPENCFLKCASLEKFFVNLSWLQITSMNKVVIGTKLRLCRHNLAWESKGLVKDEIKLNGEDDVLHNLRQLKELRVLNCQVGTIFQLEGLPISTREESGFIFSLNYLRLHELSELSFLCKGPTQSLDLQNLKGLHVVKCRRLKTIFSLSILRSFPQLEDITIKKCDELEQVIEEDEKDRYSSNCQHEQVCFPKLTRIVIRECNNLNCVFTLVSPHELPKLRMLDIEKCSLLENVFTLKESKAEDGHANMLPKLRKTRLSQLPSLSNVINLQSVKNQQVEPTTLRRLRQLRKPPQWELDSLIRDDEEPYEDYVIVENCPKLPIKYENPESNENADEGEEEEENSRNKTTEPIFNSPMHLDENKENGIDPSGTSIEETTPQNAPVVNFGKGGDSTPEFDTSRSLENSSKETSKTPVQQVLTSEKYNTVTSFLEGKDADFQTSTNQEYQTSGKEIQEESTLEEGRGWEEEPNGEEEENTPCFQQSRVIDNAQASTPSIDDNSLSTIKTTSSHDANIVRKSSVNISSSKQDRDVTPQTSLTKGVILNEDQRNNIKNGNGTSGASISSSARQDPTLEEIVNCHGLFKVDARRAALLEEAFSKYPHLWEWQKRFRPKYIKWGYESLADMLLFLKSETPKKMDNSKREEFEKQYVELESFGFNKEWLASIHQRVMEVQVNKEKLKQLEELESLENALQDGLNNVKAILTTVRDYFSKYDTAFDF